MKNILIAMTGLSPQVVTEALYALHQEGREVHEINLITTRTGKDRINSLLLASGDGAYYQYLNEYNINADKIYFHSDSIHVLKDNIGNDLDDIAGTEENEILFKTTFEIVRKLTSDPDNAVFFLIAGGRKTMSACLALSAQFFGRPQDRIYHVLVSPEFENVRDFFYPPKESKLIKLIDQKGEEYFKDTKYARIELVSIPLISIRNKLAEKTLTNSIDPAELLMSAYRDEKPKLVVDFRESKIIFRGKELDITPSFLAIYGFFVLIKTNCDKQDISCLNCNECFIEVSDILKRNGEIASLYEKIIRNKPISVYQQNQAAGVTNLDSDNFSSYRSKINSFLQKNYGHSIINDIEIASVGTRPNTKYGIKIERSLIDIRN